MRSCTGGTHPSCPRVRHRWEAHGATHPRRPRGPGARAGGVRGRERAHAAGERVGVAAELGSGDNALRREFAKAVPVVELRTLGQVAAVVCSFQEVLLGVDLDGQGVSTGHEYAEDCEGSHDGEECRWCQVRERLLILNEAHRPFPHVGGCVCRDEAQDGYAGKHIPDELGAHEGEQHDGHDRPSKHGEHEAGVLSANKIADGLRSLVLEGARATTEENEGGGDGRGCE